MSSSAMSSPATTSGSSNGRQARHEDEQLIRNLAEKWRDLCQRGMFVRHEIGALLNKRLGPPTARLPRGEKTLEKAANAIGISKSETNRMRWMAHLFDSIDQLKKEYPDCSSWNNFKKKLPGLKQSKLEEVGIKKEASPRSQHRGLIPTIRRVSDKLEGLELIPDQELDNEVRRELRRMIEVAKRYLDNEMKVTPPREGQLSATAANEGQPSTPLVAQNDEVRNALPDKRENNAPSTSPRNAAARMR